VVHRERGTPVVNCMFLSCPFDAVSSVFVAADRQPSPLAVCFEHERDLVDRYGYEDVQPRALGTGIPVRMFTAQEAVSYLRGA
jgi:hypothetical protein